MDTEMERLLTPEEVETLLNIPRRTLQELVRKGQIEAVRVTSKTMRFRPEEVDRFVADRKNKPHT